MPSFCVVANCEDKYTHSETVSFHKFPFKNESLLAQWINFTSRDDSWKPSRWSAICSRHFLKTDFRNVNARKCLKRDAVPSVKVVTSSGTELETETTTTEDEDQSTKSNCRLCGICCRAIATFATNFEIFGMIQKCFPTLNIQQDDSLPKEMCSQCLSRLKNFAEFVDDVLRTQKNLEEQFQNERYAKLSVISDRQLKIKQEPCAVNVKQEQIEGFESFLSDDIDVGMDDENDCDHKLQFCDFPALNAQDIINNCDIMEIINLDDAFIDIPDDETGVGDAAVQRVPKVDIRNVIRLEHNYYNCSNDNTPKPDELEPIYKKEIPEDDEMRTALPLFPDFSNSIFTSVHNFIPNANEPIFNNFPLKFNRGSPKPQFEYTKPNIVVLGESIVLNEGIAPRFDLMPNFQPSNYLPPTSEDEFPAAETIPETKEISCHKCNVIFPTYTEHLRHKAKVHPIKPTRAKFKLISCPFCEKPFVSKLALTNHVKYICDYKNQKDMSFGCEYCAKVFGHWRILKHHERNCKLLRTEESQKKKEEDMRPFRCDICSRSYTRLTTLKRHRKRHHPAAPDAVQQTPLQTPFACKQCGKRFPTKQSLTMHSNRHNVDKPYSCAKCTKSFTCFNNLYQHRITHTVEKKHKCELCAKVFKRRGGLNQHRKSFHLKIKPHECSVCKYKYALKSDMARCRHSILKNI